MKIFGKGQLVYPGTTREAWNFDDDGIFDTVNQQLISEARRRGFALGDAAETAYLEKMTAPVDVEKPKPVKIKKAIE